VNEINSIGRRHDPQDQPDLSDPRDQTASTANRFVPASYGDVFRGFFLAAGNNTLFRINR
jgi:hypothetical protein